MEIDETGVHVTDQELIAALADRFETARWEDIGEMLGELLVRGCALTHTMPLSNDPDRYLHFMTIGWPKIAPAMWNRIHDDVAASGREVASGAA